FSADVLLIPNQQFKSIEVMALASEGDQRLYLNEFVYMGPLRPLPQTIDERLASWSENKGANTRRLLAEGMEEVARMIVTDLQAPAASASAKTVKYMSRYPAAVVSESDTRY